MPLVGFVEDMIVSRRGTSHAAKEEEAKKDDELHVFRAKSDVKVNRLLRRGSSVQAASEACHRRASLRAADAFMKLQNNRSSDSLVLPSALQSRQLNVTMKEVDGPPSSLIKKIQRHPLTGKCYMDDVLETDIDFHLVDLKHRDHDTLSWSGLDLVHDKYLFTATPLLMRTWIYHELNRAHSAADNIYSGSIRSRIACTLATKVNDDHQAGCYGAGSSIRILAPMLLFTGLAEDFASLIVVSFALVVSLTFSIFCNTISLYRGARVLSLPIRWLLLAWNTWELLSPSDKIIDGRYHVIFANLVNVALGLYDVVDDFAGWYSVEQEASWELLSMLPGKIMVCRIMQTSRQAARTAKTNKRIDYGRDITGFDKYENVVLIADIHGLLVILKPVIKEDGNKLVRWSRTTTNPLRVFCTQSFTDQHPNADCYDSMGHPVIPSQVSASQLVLVAKRDLILRRILQLEMFSADRIAKAHEFMTPKDEISSSKVIMNFILQGFRLGAIFEHDDVELLRKALMGIEIMDEESTKKSLSYVEDQRKRAEDPNYDPSGAKKKRKHRKSVARRSTLVI
eukprot:GEMP01013438.1.p1 GENE.GEMP01013438.1~~GEMP01013438.1.p1  ORF type:complete len:567 (+),score=88.81 GEMP01013438.1:506-2206(+)